MTNIQIDPPKITEDDSTLYLVGDGCRSKSKSKVVFQDFSIRL